MSGSRRAGGGEDNILARLERAAKRGAAGKSWKHARATWCGLAGLLVIGLIGALAVLTRENLAIHRKPVLAEAKVGAFDPGAASVARSGFAPLPVGNPPRRTAAGETAKSPPMVMLKTAVPPPAKPAARARAAAAAAAPRRVKKTVPATIAVRPEPSALESDVALLSAIIMHASRHAGERAQLEATQCGAGKQCPPPDDPVSMSLKATD